MQLRMHNVLSKLAAVCGKIQTQGQKRMQTSVMKLHFMLK